MSPGQGFGIPGWFVAFFVLALVVGIGGTIWRVSAARKMARDAGLNPNTATAVALLDKDGIGAAYLGSTFAARPASTPPPPPPAPRTAEQRLRELHDLLDKGLITQAEFDARRTDILDSI